MEDTTTSAAMKGYQEARRKAIPAHIYKATVEIVKSATLDLHLATKDYVAMETQRLRADISSIVTVEVASALENADKGIVKD